MTTSHNLMQAKLKVNTISCCPILSQAYYAEIEHVKAKNRTGNCLTWRRGKKVALQKEHTDCQGRLNGPQMCSRQVKSRHQRQRLEREEPHKITPFK